MIYKQKKGTLWLIPITIGSKHIERYQPAENLKIIERVRHFIVENARTARQYIKSIIPSTDISLLNIIEIDKHKGYSYPKTEIHHILEAGEDVGVMSEAGCPAVADPGHLVVKDCHEWGFRVVPLVGPSSILLSLMGSGFNGQSFTFHGYLPFDQNKRKKIIQEIPRKIERGETQIFIEAPYRNDKLIRELINNLPKNLHLCIAIDLTSEQEEIHRYSLSEWNNILQAGKTWHKRPAIFLIGK